MEQDPTNADPTSDPPDRRSVHDPGGVSQAEDVTDAQPPALPKSPPASPGAEPSLLLASDRLLEDALLEETDTAEATCKQAALIVQAVTKRLELSIQVAIQEQMQESTNVLCDVLVKKLIACFGQDSLPPASSFSFYSEASYDDMGRPGRDYSAGASSSSSRNGAFGHRPGRDYSAGASSSSHNGAAGHAEGQDWLPPMQQWRSRSVVNSGSHAPPVQRRLSTTSGVSQSRRGSGASDRRDRGASDAKNKQVPAESPTSRDIRSLGGSFRVKKQRMSFKSLEDKMKRNHLAPLSPRVLPAKDARIFPAVFQSQRPSPDVRVESHNILPEANEEEDKVAIGEDKKNVLTRQHLEDGNGSLGVDHDGIRDKIALDVGLRNQSDACHRADASKQDAEDEAGGVAERKESLEEVTATASKRLLRLGELREHQQNQLITRRQEEIRAKDKDISSITEGSETLQDIHESRLRRSVTACYGRLGGWLSGVLLSIAGVHDISSRGICNLALQMAIMLTGCLSLAASIHQQTHGFPHHDAGIPKADLALSAGAVLGLLACGCLGVNSSLTVIDEMLLELANQKEFAEELKKKGRWDACVVMLCWCLAVADRVREVWFCMPQDAQSLFPVVSFAISSGLLMALLFAFLHICRSLDMMIDDFASSIVYIADFHRAAVEEWNVLQALLRASCASMQYLFVVLQTTIVAAITLSVVDFGNSGHWTDLVAPAIVLVAMAQLFPRASKLTDSCERMPSFVISLGPEQISYQDRMDLVEHISYSRAGFFVFEIRLTSGMVLKAFYVLCMAMFALVTKVMTGLEGEVI